MRLISIPLARPSLNSSPPVLIQNVLAAKPPNEELTFIHPDDHELYRAWETRVLELQVANHELLGSSSGKVFMEDAEGTLNFVPEKV